MKISPEMQKKCMEETYEEMKGLVHTVLWRFLNKYQLQKRADEFTSVAILGFVRAYHAHDDRAKLTTCTGNYVRYEMLNFVTDESKHCNLVSLDHDGDDGFTYAEQIPAKDGFDFGWFCEELSEDAKTVIHLAIETKKYKNTLYKMLRSMEWTRKRILEAFNEIQGALQ